MPDHPAPTDFGLLLGVAAKTYSDRLTAALRDGGFGDLRAPDGTVIRLLRHHGGLAGTELAALLGVTKQAASQLAAGLEDRGYVQQDRAGPDRRVRRLVLSDRGRAAHDLVVRLGEQLAEEVAGVHGPEGLDRLRRGLATLVERNAPTAEPVTAAAAALLRPPAGPRPAEG